MVPLKYNFIATHVFMHGATHGIVRYGVAMCVKATQGTHLGKYLTIPYRKNAMKQFLIFLHSTDKHGIDLIL